MIRKHILSFSLSVFFILLFCCGVFAASGEGSTRFKFSGFGTLGAVSGGDEILGFQRDWSRGESSVFDGDWTIKQDSLLGVQLNATFTQDFSAAVQVVARDRIENTLENSVEWAFLKYRLSPNLVVRGGRMGVDLFMLSEYRNIGFAYLWARPPIEFYGMVAFDSYDGLDLAYTANVGDGVLRAGVFYGSSKNNTIDETGVSPLDLKPVYGGSMLWENQEWRLRLGFASARLESTIGPTQLLIDSLQIASAYGWPEAGALAKDVDSTNENLYYYSAGAAFERYPWKLQSEVSFTDSNFDFLQPMITAYFSAGYCIGPTQLYGVGGFAENTGDRELIQSAPEQWASLQQGVQEYSDSLGLDQKSVSLGLRWDIRSNLAMKLQWDHYWVDAYGGVLWYMKSTLYDDRTLNTYTLNLNFIF